MKVLHVLEAIEGGTARHLSYVVRYVDAEHVVVVPPERVGGFTDTDTLDMLHDRGIPVHVVPMRRSAASRHNTTAIAQVSALIRRHKPDVVHGHSSIGGAVARIAALSSSAARVYTPNGLFPARYAMAIERTLGHVTDVFIASSPSEAEQVRTHRLVPQGRLAVVPNAIELQPPPPSSHDVRMKLGVPADTPIVGTVARLVPQKGPEVFVRACAAIAHHAPDARFVLVGDGPLTDLVESEITRLGLDDRFLLLQHCNEGPRIITQFDVFALPSRYEAGAAFAPMEAMRAGTPVVLTDVVGNRDAVEDGTSGFIVPVDAPDALADRVIRLLDDATMRQSFATAATDRLAQRFDIRGAAARLRDVYAQAARSPRRVGSHPTSRHPTMAVGSR
jgi:glycosyltransferase involved in cell wall biosynthesis